LFVVRRGGCDWADAGWAGKASTVTSVYRIRAVSSAAARNRGSARANKDGEDSSATKVIIQQAYKYAIQATLDSWSLLPLCLSFLDGECFILGFENAREIQS